jgi:hypothetical protein
MFVFGHACMYILNYSSTQEDVFQSCAYDIILSVIDGYNGSIIASGQTSKPNL